MTASTNFSHPYTPYPIQVEFMHALYDALDKYKIGIFESPTGTGKTLSLICGAMTWLRDNKRKELENSLSEVDNSDEPEWIKEEAKEMKLKEFQDRALEFEEKLQKIRQIEEREKHKAENGPKSTKRRRKQEENEQEESFLVDDYQSDTEDNVGKAGYSKQVQQLLDQLGKENSAVEEDENVGLHRTRIFFASRTHSQLCQFVGQLKMAKFPSSFGDSSVEQVKEISLSSRQQLCIHKKVSQYKTVQHKNDACMDMQKKESTRCEFMLNPHNIQDKVKSTDFRNHALAQIRDIEDLAQLGRDMGVCPYYESRRAVGYSEVVTLPYQLLVQKSARKALGIDLKEAVVVIDEAHNIMDTISSLFSMTVGLTEVDRASRGLQIYWDKFKNRLNSGNRMYLAQTMKTVKSLEAFLQNAAELPSKETMPGTEVSQSSILSQTANLVNVYKLEKYLEKSKIAFKIESYLESLQDDSSDDRKSTMVLTKVIAFLLAITNPSSEGKVFYDRVNGKIQLNYLLLDPSAHFKEIVDEARCVVLAGGTMEPVGDYLNYLFPYVKRDDIKLFNCGHVIPNKNLQVSVLGQSAAKKEFTFTYQNRSSTDQADELGKTLANVAAVVPAGVVVFFPSYQYLGWLVGQWQSSGVLARLKTRKALHSEPRDGSVDPVLNAYKQDIEQSQKGALLFAVVGGKMSEGINFSDDLARAVVMVGLPYPNLMSAEMVAKREYIERKVLENGGSKKEATDATRDFYENICMRAVNQSIGRAIRHANDYAAIVLVDSRYSTPRIRNKLPEWIRGGFGNDDSMSFGKCISSLGAFFKSR